MNRLASKLTLSLLVLLAVLTAPAWPQESGIAEEIEFASTEFEKGRYSQAADVLEELLADEPGQFLATALLLRVEMELGEFERAEELDRELAGIQDGAASPGLLLARADYAFARGRTELSEALGRSALSLASDDLHAAFVVARALQERGERQAAREWVEATLRTMSLEGRGSDGLLNVGRLLMTIGEWEQAAKKFVYAERERLREERPTTDVLLELGHVYLLAKVLNGDVPRAFSTYRDALKQNSSLVAAKVGRALTHIYVNDSWDGEKEIDEALVLNRNSVDALTVKAWFLVLDGRHTEAIERIEQALAVNPAAKKALATRAAALRLLSRTGEYDATVERVLSLDPMYGELFLTIGDALSRHLRFSESVQMHRRAIEVDPELAMAYISLGRDLCFIGAEEEGREALERSKELHPFRHPWRNNMLLILKKLDREFVDSTHGGFRFRVHADENPILAPRLGVAFEKDRKTLEERYRWSPDGPILVEMLPDHRDFSVRTVGFAGLGAVGACFGSFVTLISPRSEMRGGFVWRRTALHELAHVFTIGRSKGRVPRWLTEGLSVFEEREASETWGRDQEMELLLATANDALMPLREFNSFFRGPRIGFAYYQAGLWVRYARDTYGFDKILEMLDAYAEDMETPDVVQLVFKRTPEEMDAEFEQYLKDGVLKNTSVQPVYGPGKRAELRRALRKDKENTDLLAEVAWAYYQGNRLVDADAFLGRELARNPTNPVALRLAARRALDRKRVQLARENLEAAFKNGGAEYGAALMMAQVCQELGDEKGAEEALRTALRCFPAEVGAGNPYLGLYKLLSSQNETKEAMSFLKQFVDRAETVVRARIDLATWLMHQERFDEALLYLQQAEEADPFVREVYEGQAECFRSLGKLTQAIDALRSALLVDPRMEPGYTPPPSDVVVPEAKGGENRAKAQILITIAEIELEAGDNLAARRDLERAAQLDPEAERIGELLNELTD